MIRITDITLSCLEAFHPSATHLKQLYALLERIGSDFIEIPVAVYNSIRPASPDRLILRITTPAEAVNYPEISRFICRQSGLEASAGIMTEIRVNDIKELTFIGRNTAPNDVRVMGLDDILCHDYQKAFARIRKNLKGSVQFCPENAFYCASAAALEWVSAGGTDIAASFGGIGGKAALEEVLLALRVIRRYKPNASYEVFPETAAVLEDILQEKFEARKAVIGRGVFDVESGIHIDGIMKKPKMYEPFSPELVGRSRKLVVGKHSGRKSIAAKLTEMGFLTGNFDISRILSQVRSKSVSKQSSLTDEEFFKIAEKYRL